MKYISVLEYLGGVEYGSISDEIILNINTLIPAVNELLEQFGEYRRCNSGLRSIEHHLRIYKDINDKRIKQGLTPLKVPMSSKHLIGAAIDVEDRNGKLKTWCLKNVKLLEKLGLYCEAFEFTATWVHFQTIAPKSQSRFFRPY